MVPESVEGTASNLQVQLFGGPEVFRTGSPVKLSPFQLGLVAAVYGHGQQGIGRPDVARLLWGRQAGQEFRHRIRQLLLEIRAKCGAALFESSGDVLRPHLRVTSDLKQFEHALDQDMLLEAAKLAGRSFCAAVPDGIAEGFMDWRNRLCEQSRRRVSGRAAAKWGRGIDTFDWRAARDAAEALHVLGPSDTVALARVIEARGACGDVAAAEHAFAAYMENVADATCVDLSIRQAIDRVRRLSRSPSGDQPKEPIAPLIGRQDALQSARALFDEIAEGRFSFVLVSGESGIGKTRLLQELQREAAARDVRCLAAQAVELESRIPLNPLLDALRGVDLQAHLGALGRPWSTVIGAVFPNGIVEQPEGGLPPIQETALPRRLLDAFFLLLQRLAAEAPTILFIDDLQWADATTVAALQFVQRRWSGGALGIIASVRPELVASTDPVAKYLSGKDGLTIRRIELRELLADEAMQLVKFLAQGRIGEERSRQICELACMHPLYLTELTRDYVVGRLEIPEQAVDAVPIPVSLEQILKSRFQNLSGRAMKLAGFLAVAARPLPVSALMVLADLGLDDATDAVEELRRARLVDAEHDRVRIAHDLFRSAIYRNLGDVRRALNHRAIATYITSTSPDESTGELAIHYARAGEAELAAEYGWTAARRAMDTGAVAEAAYFYQLVSENEPVSSLRRAEATAGLARALHLNRDITRANPILELAASALRAAGRPAEALRLEIKRVEGLAEVDAAPIATLVERLCQLKDEATKGEDWEAVALALDLELQLLHSGGDIIGVKRVFCEMRSVRERRSLTASVLANAGLALGVLFNEGHDALAAAEQAVVLSRRAKEYRLKALSRMMVVLQYQGMLELPTSVPVVEEARALAERNGDVFMRYCIENNLIVASLDAGELERAESAIARSRSILGSAHLDFGRFTEAHNRAELALASGDYASAAHAFAEASKYLSPTTPSYARSLVSAGLGLCALETGDLAEARRREQELPEAPQNWYFDPYVILAFRTRLLDRRGRYKEALDLLDSALKDLEGRLVLASLKVASLRVRLMLKRGVPGAARIAQDAKATARGLCLRQRASEFDLLLTHADPP